MAGFGMFVVIEQSVLLSMTGLHWVKILIRKISAIGLQGAEGRK